MPKLPRMLCCIKLFHDVVHVNKMIGSGDSQDIRNLLTCWCSQLQGMFTFLWLQIWHICHKFQYLRTKIILSILESMWCFSSVQFSHFVVSNSLRPHELQHARPPCPLSTPGVYSNSRPLSRWCHPTISSSVIPFSSCLQSFPASGSFSSESVLHIRWPKYWSFSFNISPSNEYSGLISFRMDWLDILSVQGTLKSLLQHHSSKASILQCSAFFIVQLSHPYMTTGKTMALTRWTFAGKITSLLFNMLSRLTINVMFDFPCNKDNKQ